MSEAAKAAALDALGATGNASSIHAEGRSARAAVERARRAIAGRFTLAPDAVIFTSGGTEANALALAPGVAAPAGPVERLIVSAGEHPAVLSGGRFGAQAVQTVPLLSSGTIDVAALEATLRTGPPALVAVMAANNETGVRQPLDQVERVVRAWGARFHVDAVQAFGRVPDDTLLGDTVALSGHKLGAPQGVGALVCRDEARLCPLIAGGGQERGQRAGTENVAAIAGFAAALGEPASDPRAWEETERARADFEAALVARGAVIFGEAAPRLPNTTLFEAHMPAELAVVALDLAGVAISSGAACSSGRVSDSHVLAAMGVPREAARRALRVSTGPTGAIEAYARFLVAYDAAIVRGQAHPTSGIGPTYGL